MNYNNMQFPKSMELTDREEKEYDNSINHFFKEFCKAFFWFITVPYMLYKKLKPKV